MASFPGQKGTGSLAAPPTVPQNLTATAVSSTEIDLTWSASTDIGGPGLKFYNIYRNGLVFTSTTNLFYSDTGLNPSTLYTYNVSAVDLNHQESALSSPASATTFAPATNTVKQDQPVALVGSGFGTKSVAVPPAVWDNGHDGTPLGAFSNQWNGGGTPVANTGIYNLQNQPVGFSPTGYQIGTANPYSGAILTGCHLNSSNDSSGVMAAYRFTPPNNGTVTTYPFCTTLEYDYRYDPNMFTDPETDNNTKTHEFGDTGSTFGANQYAYFEPFPISQFPISNISQTNPCVVTCPMNQASAPASVGDVIVLFGQPGVPQANKLAAAITKVAGGNGNWLFTLGAVDGTSFSPYPAPLAISGATQANPCVIILSSTSPTHPLIVPGGKAWLWITGVAGMTQLNQQTEIAVNPATLGGSPGAWTAELVNGQFTGVNINSTGYGTYSSGGSITLGALSAPYAVAGQSWIATRGFRMNPISQLQNPDAAGHGMSSLSPVLMPQNPANGWIRRKVEMCWTQSATLTPGYLRIWDNQTLVFNFVGRTENLAPSGLIKHFTMGSVYHRDRGINNFPYFQNAYGDWGTSGGQVAKVYFGDNPVFANCTLLEPQPPGTWTPTGITIPKFNQGRFANGATGYFHVLPEASAVGTAVSLVTQYTITATVGPSITTTTLPAMTVGVPYSTTIAVTGGTAPYSFFVASASTGLGGAATPATNVYSIDENTGVLSCTPTVSEIDYVSISVYDANGYPAYAQFATWRMPATHWTNSGISLSIDAPVAGLSTTNRYYQAYPGVALALPIIVQGGAYTYYFTLTGAPAGMSIGQIWGQPNYGIITWANPIAGSYPLTVTVQDQAGVTQTVSWTLTVGASNFIFVDSINGSPSVVNGGTGDGTFAKPLKTLDDIYSGSAGHAGTLAARKASNTYAGKFVYVMPGSTLFTAGCGTEGGNSGLRVPFVGGNKPKVWMAYPGGTWTLDTTGQYIESYTDGSVGYWFDGVNAAGMDQAAGFKWVALGGPTSDNGWFNVNFQTPTIGGSTGGTNPGFVFFTDQGASIASRNFFKNCTWNAAASHELILAYGTAHVNIHNCTILGINDLTGWYAKDSTYHFWSVRECTGLAANTQEMVRLDTYPANAGSGSVEICYNKYKSSGPAIRIGPDPGTTVTGVYSFRNSWEVAQQTVDGGILAGLVVTNDALQYTNASANTHGWQVVNSGTNTSPSYSGEECVGLNNGALDANCNLQGTFRTNFLGTRGAEIA